MGEQQKQYIEEYNTVCSPTAVKLGSSAYSTRTQGYRQGRLRRFLGEDLICLILPFVGGKWTEFKSVHSLSGGVSESVISITATSGLRMTSSDPGMATRFPVNDSVPSTMSSLVMFTGKDTVLTVGVNVRDNVVSSKSAGSVCVCVCVRACACWCVCVCVWVCVSVGKLTIIISIISIVYNVLLPSDVAVPDSVVNTTNTRLSRVPRITSTLRVTIPSSSLTL